MGVIAAGRFSSAGRAGTPRAGGGTAPGGRNVAVAEPMSLSSERVGIGERPRTGGGGGVPDGRRWVGGCVRFGGAKEPKLLGASVSRAASLAGGGFAGRCALDTLATRGGSSLGLGVSVAEPERGAGTETPAGRGAAAGRTPPLVAGRAPNAGRRSTLGAGGLTRLSSRLGSRAATRSASGTKFANSAMQLAGSHSAQPERQTSVVAGSSRAASAARRSGSVPATRLPSPASQ